MYLYHQDRLYNSYLEQFNAFLSHKSGTHEQNYGKSENLTYRSIRHSKTYNMKRNASPK